MPPRQDRGVGGLSLRAGCVVRHRALDVDAVYRVLSARGRVVDVAVVAAPGLEPGTQLRLTTAAAMAMRAAPTDRLGRGRQGVRSPARREVRAIPHT